MHFDSKPFFNIMTTSPSENGELLSFMNAWIFRSLFLLVCWSMFVDYALSLNSLLIMLCHFLPTRVSLLSGRVFERNEYVIWIIFVLQWLCICACHIGCFMWSVNPYKLVSCSSDLQTFMQESNNSYKRANPNQLHYFWHCQCEIAFTTHFISVTL